jgi:hypothetical protein
MTLSSAWELHDDCLLFQGSANVLCNDARIHLTPAPMVLRADGSVRALTEGRVHSGFVRRYLELRDELPRTPPSIVAGYSPGAPLGMLNMSDVGHVQTKALLFGAPRLGDAECMRTYERFHCNRTFVFQNTRDVVVNLPPGRGYRHTGRQVRFRGPWLGSRPRALRGADR